MLQSIIISPNQEMGSRLAAELRATGHVAVCKTLPHYPTPAELSRALRAFAVEVLFLSFESVDSALSIVRTFEKENITVPIVGFHRVLEPRVLHESMRAGVREFLAEPLDRHAVMQALSHVKGLLEKRPVQYSSADQVFTFLPAKPGVGTSTIAANVSAAFARKIASRVLLADFDLSSGMVRFMMNLRNHYSVTDAVKHATDMDEDLWHSFVNDVEGMDVLQAGCFDPDLRILPEQVRTLVGFLRRSYGALCFDVSGHLEKYSLELMQESKRILLVSSLEPASLHLAREKAAFLKEMDLGHRVSLVLTRPQKKALFSEREVADLIGVPLLKVFPNDYSAVQQALERGALLPKSSELGKACIEFADELIAQQPATKPASYRHKFLEFFSPGASRAPRAAGA